MIKKEKDLRKRSTNTQSSFLFEELEPRLLLSADLPVDLAGDLSLQDESLIQLSLNELEVLETGLQQTSTYGDLVAEVRRELVFVDTDTPDYQQLLDDLLANQDDTRQFEVILLDNASDGISQITEALGNASGLDAVHIISHASDGSIELGNGSLNNAALLANEELIQTWGSAFSEGGDLLIYGCNLAATQEGQSLVDALARLTGADVAASDDLTGSAAQGGDWELEYQVGTLESSVAFSVDMQQNYQGLLATDALWLTTNTNPSPSGATGLEMEGWTAGEILQLSNPNLAFGAGTTDGTFTRAFNLDNFAQDGSATVRGIHFVGRDMTVGTNNFQLYAGDLIIAVSGEVLQNSDLSTLTTSYEDVVVFRPDTAGDYSAGMFSMLLNAISPFNAIAGITLVEQTTVVGTGGGTTTLNAGDFLISDFDELNEIIRYQPGTVGATTSGGTTTTLIKGADLGITDLIAGIDLIERDTTIGGTALTEGQILVTLAQDENPVGGIATKEQDIFILDITTTGSITVGSAQAFFTGADVGLNVTQEDITGFTLIAGSAPANSAPTATNLNAGESYTEDTTLNLTDIVISDVDSANVTAILTLSDVAAGSLSTGTSGAVTSTFAGGVWRASGAIADVNILLAGATFTPGLNYNSNFTIVTRVDDGVAAPVTGVKNMTGTAVNDDPVADAGGPYSISEGGSITLDASASSDPDSASLTYSWDINNDTVFGDITGESPTLTWAQLQSFGIDDNGVYTIKVQADDGSVTNTASTTVTVNNTAPVLSTTGSATVNEGSSYTLNLNATDPGNDTISGWTINWGDGDVETIVGNPASVTHLYGARGTFNILAAATDEDGTYLQNNLLVGGFIGTNSVLEYEATSGNFMQLIGSLGDGLNLPHSVIQGPDGYLYVSSYSGDSVLRYDTAGNFIDTFVTTASGGLNSPTYLTFGADDNLYVSSLSTNQVLRYNGTTGAFIDAFVTASSGGLTTPSGITFGTDGNLYVSSLNTNEILRYNGTTGAFMDAFVSAGSGGMGQPAQLTFGPDGNLYVSSRLDDAVHRYDGTTGAYIDAFVTSASGGIDGNVGLAFGPDGNLYVSARTSNDVMRYDGSTGAFIDAYVSSGSGGLSSPGFITFVADQQVRVNGVPVDIALSNSTVNENVDTTGGFSVGSLTSADPDSYESFSYSIVGGADMANFAIGGAGSDELILDDGVLDFETRNSYQVTVRTTDSRGGAFDKTFTVTINDLNESPMATNLTQIKNYTEGAASVALDDIVVTDVDSGDTITTTLTLANPGYGSLTAGSGNGETYTAGTGVWTITGSVSAVNTALAAVAFVPTTNNDQNTSINTHVEDASGTGPADGNITLTVTAVNDAPVAVDDSYNVNEGSGGFLPPMGVLLNDSDIDSGTLTAIQMSNVANGTLSMNPNGSWWYSPDPDYYGTDSFTYKVNDGSLDSNIATVTLNIAPRNDAPTGSDNTVTTLEDTDFVFSSSDFGFSDPVEGDGLLAVRITTLPGAGALTLVGSGAVSAGDFISKVDIDANRLIFTPVANANGPGYASFTFQVQDNGGTANSGVDLDQSTNTLTIDVTAVNDAPVANSAIILAGEDTGQNASAPGLMSNDTDAEGTAGLFVYAVDGNPASVGSTITLASGALLTVNADGSTSYNTNAAFEYLGSGDSAVDSFTYTISDTGGLTSTASVTVFITGVNDGPVTDNISASGNEDTASIAITLTGSDIDGTVDFYRLNGLPANGTLYTDAGLTTAAATATDYVTTTGALTLYFVPDANWSGNTAFQYVARDDNGLLDATPATAAIVVNPVNDAPVISTGLIFNLAEDAVNGSSVGGVTANDVDASGSLQNWQIISGNSAGVFRISPLTGELSVADNTALDYETNTSYVLGVQVGDGITTSTVEAITLDVININEAPYNRVPTTQTTSENTPLAFSSLDGNGITVSDPDGSGTTVEVTLSVLNGTLGLSGTSGLVFSTGSGTGDTAMTFTGNVVDINAALDGLLYQPDLGYQGFSNLTIITDDLGGSGVGGALNAMETVTISVVESASAPSLENILATLDVLIGDFNEPQSPGTVPGAPSPFITDSNSVENGAENAFGPGLADSALTESQMVLTNGSGDSLPGQFDVSALQTHGRDNFVDQQHDRDRPSSSVLIQRAVHQALTNPLLAVSTLIPLGPDAPIWSIIDVMMGQMSSDNGSSTGQEEILVKTTKGLTFTLTAGYVSWLLRAGYLSASLISIAPLWREFDPLPILGKQKKDKRQSDGEAKDTPVSDELMAERVFATSEQETV